MAIRLIAYNLLSIVIGIIFEIPESEVSNKSSKYEFFNLLLMLSSLFQIDQQRNIKYHID